MTMRNHQCPHCRKPFRTESKEPNFCPYGCGAINGLAGYVTAFYEIADLLGVPAQALSPQQVFEEQIKPRIAAFASASPHPDTVDRERADLKARLRNIVSHATGGNVDIDEHPNWTVNGVCVAISQHRTQIWNQAQEAALRDAALASVSPDSGWRDIATAPDCQDGVLICDTTKPNPAVGVARLMDGEWRGANLEWGFVGECIWPTPTHWQPLPTPPVTEGEQSHD